jgi:hypothetical protein
LIVQATRSEAPRSRNVVPPRKNTTFCPVELGILRSMHVIDRRPPDGRHLERHARSGLVCLVRGHPVTVIRGARSFLFPKKIETQVGSSTITTNQQTKLNSTMHPSQPTRLGKCYPHDRPFHLVSRTQGLLVGCSPWYSKRKLSVDSPALCVRDRLSTAWNHSLPMSSLTETCSRDLFLGK